ncbi:MAG: cellulase family glycosylhydrolase [Prevotella sp.]|nr:cellulase family glycosylhydrolase [Prevotella sp.]
MKRIIALISILWALGVVAQGVKPLPSLHTEGRWLVDKHGNQVVLHGVMDTPNMYFNGWRWGSPWTDGTNYDDKGVAKCLAYFEKLFWAMEQAHCDVFRLHLDPAWTNDPSDSYVYSGSNGQSADASGEADIKKFNPERLKKFLPSLYLKLAEMAMNHGLYVVVRPPGVCPRDLKVNDYYQQYLVNVWDIVSQQAFVKEHAGQISIELANEPVNVKNANNQDDAKALHDYFQPMVDKIRNNGFDGIIWVPGTGYQSNYRSYAEYPIEGKNIGYAVHDYPGWYNSSDDNPDPDNKIAQFHASVPVIDAYPIFITEVDWSPIKEPKEIDHYNEMNQPVYKNLGTWATGTTSKWGKAFKAVLDYFGNISMTLTHPHDFMDLDALYGQNAVTPAFGGNPEACGKACMDWYAEYYKVNYPHADDEEETGDFYTVKSFAGEKEAYELMVGDNIYLSMKLGYADGHVKDVSEVATYTIDHPSVVEVKNGYLIALSDGDATITASYTDVKGTVWQASFTVKVSKFEISGMKSMSSLSEIVEDHFAMLNKESQKLFYGSDAQNLGYDDANMVINNKNINGYMFKAEPISGREGCYLLRLITLSGSEYSIWGSPGYLNGYSTVADCSFILGLNNQYGQDVKDGAVWEINYESGKGFTLKNMYTGKYLRDNASASSEAPVYMDFLKVGGTAGINAVKRDVNNDAVYTLQGQKIATCSQWNTLPRGVYIVNGKKVIK